MASSRRTSLAQVTQQEDWVHIPTEEITTYDTRGQNYPQHEQISERRDPDKGREISEIMCKHLEQVISAMIPSSTCSSSDQIESAPVNSMVTQMTHKNGEDMETRKTLKQEEKQNI